MLRGEIGHRPVGPRPGVAEGLVEEPWHEAQHGLETGGSDPHLVVIGAKEFGDPPRGRRLVAMLDVEPEGEGLILGDV